MPAPQPVSAPTPPALQLIVADTDAVSFIIKADPLRGPRYQSLLAGHRVVLPFSVAAELHLWAEDRHLGPRRRAAIAAFIQNCHIHYPDERLCGVWATVVAEGRRTGRPIAPHDAWNAAVALFLGVPLVTHNARDYAAVPRLRLLTSPDA